MIRTTDLHWLAGLMEGEGSFHVSHAQPRAQRGEKQVRETACVALCMTDRDVVERAKAIFGLTSKTTVRERANGLATKPSYLIQMTGRRAIGWMLTLWPLLGERRRARIAQIVKEWRARPTQRQIALRNAAAINGRRTQFGGGY